MEAALQILSKVILSKDYSIIENNLLNEEYFVEYEDEFKYIKKHYKKYGNVPDKFTFLSKFPEVDLVEVTETDEFLIDTVREERLYVKSVPVVRKIAKLLKDDANAAIEYMWHSMKELQPNYQLGGTDLISQAELRYQSYVERKEHKDDYTFTTGFPELDGLIHGIERVEEFILIFARINNGKSFVAQKICTHVWQLGFNVGYLSPEMSALSLGYRFDTIYKGFSNKSLMWADKSTDSKEYKQYIDNLKTNQNKYIISTPEDFDKKITISKIREWVKQFKLDLIVIDGIGYLSNERERRGESKAESLTDIGEDIVSLSNELHIPVIVVHQANRMGSLIGEDEDDTPGLENIKDSDGLAANATKVLSLRHKDDVLKIGVKKNRFGLVGGHLNYNWNPDVGDFVFIPSLDDAEPEEKTDKKVKKMKRKIKDKEDVF